MSDLFQHCLSKPQKNKTIFNNVENNRLFEKATECMSGYMSKLFQKTALFADPSKTILARS